MLSLRDLAQQRSTDSSESEESWLKTLSRAYKALSSQSMPDTEFSQLVQTCHCPEDVSLLAREFFRFSKQDSQQRSAVVVLSKEVDESDFDFEQWIEAILVMYHWLDEKQKTSDLATILGYLNCCAQAPDNKLGQRRFSAILTEFLSEHGFERAKEL